LNDGTDIFLISVCSNRQKHEAGMAAATKAVADAADDNQFDSSIVQ